jgi:hypothetical protein
MWRWYLVLQARFSIVSYLALAWFGEEMWKVMNDCMTLQNMIVKSERTNSTMDDHSYGNMITEVLLPSLIMRCPLILLIFSSCLQKPVT